MKNSWSWVVGVAVSAAALAIAFWGADPRQLSSSLRAGDYLYLLPSTAMLVLGLLARAKSWHTLLGGAVPYGRAFHALNEGYLLNNVLPFKLGEIGRAYLVSRGRALSGSRALSSVFLERLIDLSVSLSVLLAALPFALSVDWAQDAARASIVLLLGLYLGLFLALRLRDRRLHVARGGIERVPVLRSGPWARRAESFMDGLEAFRDGRRLLVAMWWSTVAWTTYGVQLWFLMQAFFPAPPAAVVGLVLGITAVGAAVPSSPGAVGVFEASVLAALLAFGYAREAALSFAVTLHLSVLVTTSLFGAAGLIQEGESLVEIARSARAYVRGARSAREPSPALE